MVGGGFLGSELAIGVASRGMYSGIISSEGGGLRHISLRSCQCNHCQDHQRKGLYILCCVQWDVICGYIAPTHGQKKRMWCVLASIRKDGVEAS